MTFQGHEREVTVAIFGRGMYYRLSVITASLDATAKVWDVSTGECLRTFADYGRPLRSLEISRDGALLLTSSIGMPCSTIKLWSTDPKSESCVLLTLIGQSSRVQSTAISPDGSSVLTCTPDGSACLWDIKTRRLTRTFLIADGVFEDISASFSDDGSSIIAAACYSDAVGEPNLGKVRLLAVDSKAGCLSSVSCTPEATSCLDSSFSFAQETLLAVITLPVRDTSENQHLPQPGAILAPTWQCHLAADATKIARPRF